MHEQALPTSPSSSPPTPSITRPAQPRAHPVLTEVRPNEFCSCLDISNSFFFFPLGLIHLLFLLPGRLSFKFLRALSTVSVRFQYHDPAGTCMCVCVYVCIKLQCEVFYNSICLCYMWYLRFFFLFIFFSNGWSQPTTLLLFVTIALKPRIRWHLFFFFYSSHNWVTAIN